MKVAVTRVELSSVEKTQVSNTHDLVSDTIDTISCDILKSLQSCCVYCANEIFYSTPVGTSLDLALIEPLDGRSFDQ